jgi:molybdopterin-guanine dinucleotide biosynthesis protein A
MSRPADIAGIILAGGLSRRMFPVARDDACADPHGGDKGLLDVGAKPMLAHVVERLGPQVGAMALNANGDPARFAGFGLPVVADTIGGFVGPLAGVLAGMRWAREALPGARWVVSTSSDAPFLPRDLVSRLAASVRVKGNAIAIAQSEGELHPVIGLWPVALAEDLEGALRGGLRKVLAWTDKHGTVPVGFDMISAGGRRIDPFFNANTPEDLAEARRCLALIEGAGA